MKKKLSMILLILMGLFLVSCAGEDAADDATSTDLTISGVLATGSSKMGLVTAETAITDYSVYCVTFEVPPVAGTGSLNGDGEFELTLTDGKEKPFGCFILGANNAVVATLVVEDSTKQGLTGANEQSSQIALAGNANFGNIVLDLEKGVAVADKAKIVDEIPATSQASGDVFDFSGTWELSAGTIGADETDLYTEFAACGNENNGPCDGMQVFMQRLQATEWPDVTKPLYGISMWQNQAAFTACGSKIGVTVEQGKEMGVDFSGLLPATVTEGAYTWLIGWADGWKNTDATAPYAMYSYNGTTWAQTAAQGASCAGMADGVGKLQCYASYYNANQPNGCTRKINTNWQATTVADFLYDDGAPRPNGMIAFEKFNFTSATTGGFFMHSEWSQGFNDDGDVDQDGNFNEWHQCGVSEDVAINIIKTSDTAMVGDLTFKTKLYQMPGQSAAVFAACATEIASELGDARYKINFTKQ